MVDLLVEPVAQAVVAVDNTIHSMDHQAVAQVAQDRKVVMDLAAPAEQVEVLVPHLELLVTLA
jgi:hypothetical protein